MSYISVLTKSQKVAECTYLILNHCRRVGYQGLVDISKKNRLKFPESNKTLKMNIYDGISTQLRNKVQKEQLGGEVGCNIRF